MALPEFSPSRKFPCAFKGRTAQDIDLVVSFPSLSDLGGGPQAEEV